MNEQTKELAMKYANKMGNSVIHNAEHLEEFAELIVRECVKIAYQNDIAKFTRDGYQIGMDIQKHFGVEE